MAVSMPVAATDQHLPIRIESFILFVDPFQKLLVAAVKPCDETLIVIQSAAVLTLISTWGVQF